MCVGGRGREGGGGKGINPISYVIFVSYLSFQSKLWSRHDSQCSNLMTKLNFQSLRSLFSSPTLSPVPIYHY